MSRSDPPPSSGFTVRALIGQFVSLLLVIIAMSISLTFLFVQQPTPTPSRTSTIVLIWDGMRPDMVAQNLTPNLLALGDNNASVALDEHAVFPSVALVDSASQATGDPPGSTSASATTANGSGALATPPATPGAGTGIDSGAPFWLIPTPSSSSAPGSTPTGVVATATATPVATSTAATLPATPTLTPGATNAAGTPTPSPGIPTPTTTATPASSAQDLSDTTTQLALQQSLAGGLVQVPTIAQVMVKAGLNVAYEGSGGEALLASLAPVAQQQSHAFVVDGTFTYPSSLQSAISGKVAASTSGDAYLTQVFTQVLLPQLNASGTSYLSVIDYAGAEKAAETYGFGSPQHLDALRTQDAYLGDVLTTLTQMNLSDKVNLIITSGHGLQDILPPARTTQISASKRTDIAAQLMAEAARGKAGMLPDVGANGVSRGDLTDATTVVVTAGGGDDALSFPDTPAVSNIAPDVTTARETLIREVILWLQQQSYIGPIFVNETLGQWDGTLPLSDVALAGPRAPALVFTFAPTPGVVAAPGTNSQGFTGASATDSDALATSGTLSRDDMHAIFYGRGPSFKQNVRDIAPTGAIDLAPTLATILDVTLPGKTQGRAITELLTGFSDTPSGTISESEFKSTRVTLSDGQSMAEVVEVDHVGDTLYIRAAAAVRGAASLSDTALFAQAQQLAEQE